MAVVWALAFAWAAGVHLAFSPPMLLVCCTWSVYVGDRLLDAHRAIRSGNLGALRERHYFHWRHRRLLIPFGCVAAAVTIVLIVGRMPAAARKDNSVLAAAALAYFTGVHSTARLPVWLRRVASKEMLVGVLFAAGTIAPTVARIHFIGWPFLACFAIFAILAWTNCSAIEGWESSRVHSGIASRATLLGITCILVSATLASVNWRLSALAASAATSALLLSLLDRRRANLSPLTLRALADLVLLTPLAAVLIGANHT